MFSLVIRVIFWVVLLLSGGFASISLQKTGIYGGIINDMKIGGRYLYSANRQGIGVVTLSDPLNLREVSFVTLKKEVTSLFVDTKERKLYVAFKNGGFALYSLNNPAYPKKISEYEERDIEILDIKIQNGYAYLASKERGVIVVDVSNEKHFFKVGSLDTPGFAKKLIIRGNTAFLLDNHFGIEVINISNPSNPFFERKFRINQKDIDMALKGRYLYITNANQGLLVMDVQNPKALDWSKQAAFISTKSYFSKIYIYEDLLFVLEGDKNIKIMNILDPLNPVILSSYETKEKTTSFIAQNRQYLYLSGEGTGIETVNISDIQNPKHYARYIGEDLFAKSVVSRGRYAYMADGYFGVHVVDISNEEEPKLVSFINTDSAVSSVCLKGRYAYIMVKEGKIIIADVIRPKTPKIIKTLKTGNEIGGCYIKNDFLFVSKGKRGFDIYDISDGKDPLKTGDFLTGGDVFGMSVKGDYVYIADGIKGISIVDISYPYLPFLEKRISVGKSIYTLKVRDRFLYAGCERCMKIYDISNVKVPVLKSTYNVTGSIMSLELRGDHALLGIKNSGMEMVNIKDFSNIYPESFVDINSFDGNVLFNYDLALSASGRGGLEIYKIYTHNLYPKDLYAFAMGKSSAYIFWDKLDGIDGYYLTRIEIDSGKREVIAILDPLTEDYEDFSLLPNTRYQYELRASTEFGLSQAALSDIVLTEGGSAPVSPGDFVARLGGNKEAVLTWVDNSDDENSFYITRHNPDGSAEIVAILPANTTSYKDTKLKTGGEYSYEIIAVNEFGKSTPVFSNKIKIVEITAPKAPANFTATLKDDKTVLLRWEDRSDNEQNFIITRKNPDGTFEKIATLAADTTSFVDKNVSKDGVYQYDIASLNSAGVSKRVLSNSIKIGGDKIPAAPSDFKARAMDGKVKLTWQDNSDNENGFYITRNNSDGTLSVIAFVKSDITEYTDEDVQPGSVYSYQILAMNDNGISDWATSNEVTISGGTVPKTPSLVSVKQQSDGSVKITWQDNSDNEIGFYLEREESGQTSIIIAILDANNDEYIDKDAKDGVTYRYFVSAFNDFGNSPKSKSNEITVKK